MMVANVADMDIGDVELRPVLESDLDFLCRFDVEPGLKLAGYLVQLTVEQDVRSA